MTVSGKSSRLWISILLLFTTVAVTASTIKHRALKNHLHNMKSNVKKNHITKLLNKNHTPYTSHIGNYRRLIGVKKSGRKSNDFPYQWVSSSAFLLSSDLVYHIHHKDELSLLDPNSVIYVQSGSELANFQEDSSELLHSPFILISGTTTNSVPSEIQELNAQLLLDNPYLVHWYTQNYDGSIVHPKLSGIPLGPNFHSLDPDSGESNIPHISQGGKNKPKPYMEQSQELTDLANNMPPIKNRMPKIYYDAHNANTDTRHVNDPLLSKKPNTPFLTRSQIAEKFKEQDFFFLQDGIIPRQKQWQLRTEYAFAISPVGRGLDCHRIWESLMLGQIVIVQSTPLDPLYEGLPVVIVNNWDEVTQENLDIWKEQYSDTTTNPEYRKRLSFKYWYEKTHDFSQNVSP